MVKSKKCHLFSESRFLGNSFTLPAAFKVGIFVFILLFISPSLKLRAAVNISKSSLKSTYPRIAVDPSDQIHVVWVEKYSEESGDLFYSKSDSQGAQWTTPINLSNSRQAYCETRTACDVDTDDYNNVYAAWIEDHNLNLRIYSGNSWGSTFRVYSSGGGLDTVSISVSTTGDIYLVWWSVYGIVYSRARVNNVWESPKVISDTGRRSKFPRINVGNQRVYACWTQKNSSLDQYEIVYASRGASLNSSWGSIHKVYPNNYSQQYPGIVVDNQDDPYVVWSSLVDGPRVVHGSDWNGSGFSSPVAISSIQLLHYSSVFEQYGDIYACWQVGGYEAGLAIYYSQYKNGQWSEEEAVSSSGGSTFSDISASPDGARTYVTWDGNDEIYFNAIGSTPSSNRPPVASFDFSPETGTPPLKVTFDASLSRDTDGKIVQYGWSFGDGAVMEGKTVTHTYEKAGNYIVLLLVRDDKGAIDIESKPLTVLDPNDPPVANFTFSPSTGIFPLQVVFDASSSYDPDGSIARYSWTFGDGATGQGSNPWHSYTHWGNFSITLTVEDNRGAKDTKTASITVLRLFQPLNIRWETHNDDSLFLTRYITNIRWDVNPSNYELAEIVRYRIYRKETPADISAFQVIGEVEGQIFAYDDLDVDEQDKYSYTVTAIDSLGHESPIDYSSTNLDVSKKITLDRMLRRKK